MGRIGRSNRHEDGKEVRPSAGHSRPPDSPGCCARANPRLCDCPENSANVSGCSAGAAGLTLPCAPPPRVQEVSYCRLETHGDAPRSKILSPHCERKVATAKRDRELGSP